MTNIRAVDMLFLDDVFEMGGGYVLNFSDRTFAQFFAEELNLDIDDPAYAVKCSEWRFERQTPAALPPDRRQAHGGSHSQRSLGVSGSATAAFRQAGPD